MSMVACGGGTDPANLVSSPVGGTAASDPPGTSGTASSPSPNSGGTAQASAATFTIGGSVNGLSSFGLVFGDGTDTLSLPADATSFAFPTSLPQGANYSVNISGQPIGLTCAVVNGSGSIGTANVTNVAINCHDTLWVVTTAAGSTVAGTIDGTGNSARFNSPTGTAVDANGNVYVADSNNNLIRRIQPDGLVTTFAGSGATGAANGSGNSATFNDPQDIAVAASGNVYVADTNNNMIRKITPDGEVTILAGATTAGYDDDVGGAARFNSPQGVAVDANENVFVADTDNCVIREIAKSGLVSTVAGNGPSGCGSLNGTGTAAQFNNPTGVTVDAAGYVFVADWGNNKIREISPTQVVTTFAGSGTAAWANGIGATAAFDNPVRLAVDANDTVYVVDNVNEVVRAITKTGLVTTIAGTPNVAGSADGIGLAASFHYPLGISIDTAGNLYVGDYGNFEVRLIMPQ